MCFFCLLPIHGVTGQEQEHMSGQYKALVCPQQTLRSTWAILKRDGANRETEPYLSSLGQGESGTGIVSSPPFLIEVDTIHFTIRGHDGQGGGKKKLYRSC